MKMFTAKTKLFTITRCKQFKPFKKYIIAPRAFRAVMGIYSLKALKMFFPFNADDCADALNYMRNMADGGNFTYTPFNKKDTGIYSFIIEKNKPFVLILPGGGYNDVCSLIEGYSTAMHFNKLEYNVFIGNYSVGKNARYPSPQDDVAEMLKWIFSNSKKMNVDTEKYAICGFSAGGHLAATWGLKSVGYAHYDLPKPECEVLCYPVITMGEHTHIGSRNNLLGKESGDKHLQQRYSVELQADKEYPKTFLWQCESDPLKNSRLLHDRLTEVGVKHIYEVFEGGAHGIGAGIGTSAEGWIEKAISLWREEL